MHDTLLSWRAKEYEKRSKSKQWYIIAGVVLSAIILYALLSNSPVMAVTFILIGVAGYLLLEKHPDETHFSLSSEGISADNELYEYENIHSFWIFYDPDAEQSLSLRVKSGVIPFIKIPLGNQDPVKIREILLQYIPEQKHKKSFIDIVEKFF